MFNISTVILAAGKSTRFKSKKSKLLHDLAGLPIIAHVYNIAKKISGRKIIIKLYLLLICLISSFKFRTSKL